jgi:hypothetical protein
MHASPRKFTLLDAALILGVVIAALVGIWLAAPYLASRPPGL